jgi:hypothetical protein
MTPTTPEPAMHTFIRLVPCLALLFAPVVACDEKGPADGAPNGAEQDDDELECDADHIHASRTCGDDGLQFCGQTAEGPEWGVCVADPECEPGDDEDPCFRCELDPFGSPYWVPLCDNDGGEESTTPLVLSFDGAPVEYVTSGLPFDLGPQCAATDWPAAATPWLALDRDRSGAIDGGHELFGSATRLRTGARADNGFAALAELDADGDGRISAADPGFADLVVWSDADGDRRSGGLELQPLAAFGLVAIDLQYAAMRRCDGRSNCEVERAAFVYTDALGRARTGEVVDVHLACR